MSGKQRIAKPANTERNFHPTTTNTDHVALWSLMGVFLASCGGGGGGGGAAATGLSISGELTGTRMEHAVATTLTDGTIMFNDAQDAPSMLAFLVAGRNTDGSPRDLVEITTTGTSVATGQEIGTQFGTITFHSRANAGTEAGDQATIEWDYVISPDAAVPEEAFETITVQVRDSGGGLAQQNIVITAEGENDDVMVTIPRVTVNPGNVEATTMVGAPGTDGTALTSDTPLGDITAGHRVILAVTEVNGTAPSYSTWHSITFEDEESAPADMRITISLGEDFTIDVETTHNSATNHQEADIMRDGASIGEFQLYRVGDTVTFRFELNNEHPDLNDNDPAAIEILPVITVIDVDVFGDTESPSPQRETIRVTARITDVAEPAASPPIEERTSRIDGFDGSEGTPLGEVVAEDFA